MKNYGKLKFELVSDIMCSRVQFCHDNHKIQSQHLIVDGKSDCLQLIINNAFMLEKMIWDLLYFERITMQISHLENIIWLEGTSYKTKKPLQRRLTLSCIHK